MQNGSGHEEWIALRVYAIVRDATVRFDWQLTDFGKGVSLNFPVQTRRGLAIQMISFHVSNGHAATP